LVWPCRSSGAGAPFGAASLEALFAAGLPLARRFFVALALPEGLGPSDERAAEDCFLPFAAASRFTAV
jgi:hypothetical protein